ncbi:hypothetical protein AB9F41_35850, partial [Rhizobium leguminosarum]|uniref:hypothetical protein n=1 Tax=Rhizobium leguminosarum TaxID=384 RepID=UPI003F970967
AVGAGRRRNLEGLALVGVYLRRCRQIDRSIFTGNFYRFGRLGNARHEGEGRQENRQLMTRDRMLPKSQSGRVIAVIAALFLAAF